MSQDMPVYTCRKQVRARPMSRQAYNDLRNWALPKDENGEDEGYLVEYLDGGQRNHPDFEGYISWSPKDVFERGYSQDMDFGDAIRALKDGATVARKGWNGKGMWLKLVPTELADTVAFQHAALRPLPWIGMKTADQHFVPWLASQTDMLSTDWEIILP